MNIYVKIPSLKWSSSKELYIMPKQGLFKKDKFKKCISIIYYANKLNRMTNVYIKTQQSIYFK